MNETIIAVLMILAICGFLAVIASIIGMIRNISSNVHNFDVESPPIITNSESNSNYLYIVIVHPSKDISLGKFEI